MLGTTQAENIALTLFLSITSNKVWVILYKTQKGVTQSRVVDIGLYGYQAKANKVTMPATELARVW